jgi:hypothetical protein
MLGARVKATCVRRPRSPDADGLEVDRIVEALLRGRGRAEPSSASRPWRLRGQPEMSQLLRSPRSARARPSPGRSSSDLAACGGLHLDSGAFRRARSHAPDFIGYDPCGIAGAGPAAAVVLTRSAPTGAWQRVDTES